MKILAALEEEYEAEEMAEALGALFEARNISAKVSVIEVCRDIQKLNQKVQNVPENSKADGE